MDRRSLYLLVELAIGIGWYLRGRTLAKRTEKLVPNYCDEIDHLFNQEPDRAVVAFIEKLEVNRDT